MTARFDLIGLVVADMARTLAFYRMLGLDLPPEADHEAHVEVALLGGLRMAFDTREVITSFDPTWTPSSGGHALGLAFACDDAADVDRVHAELLAAGYGSHLEPWDAVWGQRYAAIVDPDGNTVDLFAPLQATPGT